MRRILDPDNFFFQGCNRILDTAVLSLIWLALLLPVVTAGPATTALYYTVVKCMRRGEKEPYGNFFRCFRANFKIGAVAGVILAAVVGLLAVEYGMLVEVANAGSRGAVVLYYALCVCALLLIGAGLYVFPLLSRFSCTLGGLFMRALHLALLHLPSTALLLCVNLGAVWLCLTFGLPYLLPFLCVPVLAALLSSLILERIFQKYTPGPSEEAEP